jgi:ribosomal protein L37AE/L43A
VSAIFSGPQCPHCSFPLPAETLHTGTMTCPSCRRVFEGTVFEARDRQQQPVQAAAETPDGTATACANHPRNAAVTSCRRCGLFICSLCEMNLGDGAYCPSCFDRVRAEGTVRGIAKRRMDYAMLARVAALLGLIPCFYGMPSVLGVWLAAKGIGQRRSEGVSTRGMVFVLIVTIVELIAYVFFVAFLIYTIARTPNAGATP